jgi:hypothetical protein
LADSIKNSAIYINRAEVITRVEGDEEGNDQCTVIDTRVIFDDYSMFRYVGCTSTETTYSLTYAGLDPDAPPEFSVPAHAIVRYSRADNSVMDASIFMGSVGYNLPLYDGSPDTDACHGGPDTYWFFTRTNPALSKNAYLNALPEELK